jgi:sulfatase modifying factor 1
MNIRMTYIAFICLVFAGAASAHCQENGARKAARALDPAFEAGRQWLVEIAISSYEEWPSLSGPREDAESLRSELVGDYYIDKVITLYDGDATRANVAKLFVTLQEEVGIRDSLLIFYAGHGYLDRSSDTGFWIPTDAGRSVFEQKNWLTNSQIRGYIANIKSTHVCVIMDSCFGGDILATERGKPGTIGTEYFKKAYRRTSRQVLTSGASESVPDKSEFARLLVCALEKNTSPYIDPLMLYDEVRLGMTETTPLFGYLRDTGHQEGASFLLFRKPLKQTNDEGNSTGEDVETERITRVLRGCAIVFSDAACEIYVDGKMEARIEGGTKLKIESLPVGKHTLEARFDTGSVKKEIEVSSKQAVNVSFVRAKEKPQSRMVEVGVGRFVMGAREGVSHERPAHEVLLRSFSIARFETTFSEYDLFCEATGKEKPDDRGWGRGARPVVSVTWRDAVEYCNWLSDREGYARCFTISEAGVACDFGANGYRLPTEAEWEYAARAGYGSRYAGSEDPGKVAWYRENAERKTHEVGKKEPNRLGLFDMSGNVWEWCWDFYDSNFYAHSPGDSPSGPETGKARVLRGGSWYNGSSYERVTARGYADENERTDMFGFRVVRTARR